MWQELKEALLPFSAIASELRIIRELYEKELESRNPPVVRITESPGSDTEVTYMGVEEEKKKSALTRLAEVFKEADEEE